MNTSVYLNSRIAYRLSRLRETDIHTDRHTERQENRRKCIKSLSYEFQFPLTFVALKELLSFFYSQLRKLRSESGFSSRNSGPIRDEPIVVHFYFL